jgi:Asp-tRNA(Asn)/Glu-tRNA(Gln) amidotransferase A subunit family amidase
MGRAGTIRSDAPDSFTASEPERRTGSAAAPDGRPLRGESSGAFLRILTPRGQATGQLQMDRDVILMPTVAQPPVAVGSISVSDVDSGGSRRRSRAFNPYCSQANRTSVPACSVPLHWSDACLRIDAQCLGRFGEEATLFRLPSSSNRLNPGR